MSFLQFLNQVEWPFWLGFFLGFLNPATTAFSQSLFWALSVLSCFSFSFPFLLSLCHVSPWTFGFSCSFSPAVWLPVDFEVGSRVEGVSAPCNGDVGEWLLRLSSLRGLKKTKGKDRINEAGCESFHACLQGLCSSSSSWVFEHPGRARAAHLKVRGTLKQLRWYFCFGLIETFHLQLFCHQCWIFVFSCQLLALVTTFWHYHSQLVWMVYCKGFLGCWFSQEWLSSVGQVQYTSAFILY